MRQIEREIDVIPGIPLLDGAIAIAGPEGYRKEDRDLFEYIENIRKETKRLYIMDLNGIHGRGPQLDLLQEIAAEIDIWVDSGAWTAGDVMDIITVGAEKAVMGTKSLKSLDEVSEALSFTRNIIFSLDILGGKVAATSREIASMSIGELAEWAKDVPIMSIYEMSRRKGDVLNRSKLFEEVERIEHPMLYMANIRMDEIPSLPSTVRGIITRYEGEK